MTSVGRAVHPGRWIVRTPLAQHSGSMSRRIEFNRAVVIAVIVGAFFVVGLVAMLLTGILSGGDTRT